MAVALLKYWTEQRFVGQLVLMSALRPFDSAQGPWLFVLVGLVLWFELMER